MSKASELIESLNEATRKKRSPEEVKALIAKHGEVKGGGVIVQGKAAAHDNLVDQIHMSAEPKISREDAHHVANFYLKHKLAKLDHITRQGTVKHGAYLDGDVIHNALNMAKKTGK